MKTCPSKKECRECGKHHYTLLHRSNDHQLNCSTDQSNPSDSDLSQHQKVTSLTESIAGKTDIIQSCQVLVNVEGRIQIV